MRVLKEADETVNVLSSLFGGGSYPSVLSNMTFADPAMASLFSGMLCCSRSR